MVTHDVDEAVFLSDRVVMMTNGPEARVGKILDIDLPRPRSREQMLDDARFYDYRGQIIEFLENCPHEKANTPVNDKHVGVQGAERLEEFQPS
jgi:nitrate/nitrite transport system ATP-binding protein